LTTTSDRIVEKGWGRKVTEKSSYFLVVAGGQIRAGNLGRHSRSENELLKILETMKAITEVIGLPGGPIVESVIKKFLGPTDVN
jgi:hypothetical protein